MKSLWITIGTKTRHKIGIIYAPQGDKIKKAEQREIYNNISEQIKEGRENGEKVYVMGDFNAKIGESIVNGMQKLKEEEKSC